MAEKTSDPQTILSVTVGNDLTQIGISEGEALMASWQATTPPSMTADEAGVVLHDFFTQHEWFTDVSEFRIDGSIVASVVPALTDAWVQALRKVGGSRPLVVGPGLKTGIRMNYNDPAEIGADRIANMVAARNLIDGALIVVDLGTTTNFSVLDNAGAFCGSVITAGLRPSAKALSTAAAKLASVEVKTPTSVLGKSTSDAMRSGIVMGEAAKIDGLIERIWEELGYETEVIATGSGIDEVAALTKHVMRIEENLTMSGLAILYLMNRAKK